MDQSNSVEKVCSGIVLQDLDQKYWDDEKEEARKKNHQSIIDHLESLKIQSSVSAMLLIDLTESDFHSVMLEINRRFSVSVILRFGDAKKNYSTVTVGQCGMHKNVIMKDCLYSKNAKEIALHEANASMLNEDLTPHFVGITSLDDGKGIRIAFKYYEESLADLMNKRDVAMNWHVIVALLETLAEFERNQFYVRDFRLESFRVQERKKPFILKQIFSFFILIHISC